MPLEADGLDVAWRMRIWSASESGVALHFPPHSKVKSFSHVSTPSIQQMLEARDCE